MDGAGAGTDAFGSSSASLTWRDFLERMRKPAAAELVNSIKSFIVNFTSKAPDPDKDSAAVQEFLTNMEGAFRAHSLWAGCSEEELESAGEGLEKYVMTKLYNRAFASLPEDKNQDEELFLKMSLVQQFIRPEHLDIQPTFQNETSWLLAQKELQKINMYKAPRDKLVCILNCCKVINNLLLNASLASSENPPGADEFLPVLIYVTIKANPPQLHSNLLYIQRYRCQSRLVSEAAYYFTNILSAESFIWNIDAKAISMDEEEFQKNMESARALILGLSGGLQGVTNQNARDSQKLSPVEYQGHLTENIKPNKVSSEQSTTMSHPQVYASETSKESDQTEEHYTSKKASTSDLETKGAIDILKADQLNRYFSEYPFLYASAGDLTVNDVETLLNSYKQLVLKYVSLSKGTGISSPSPVTEQLIKIEKECEQNGTIVGEANTSKFDEFVEAVEDSMVSSEDRVAAMVAEKTENSTLVTNDENSS